MAEAQTPGGVGVGGGYTSPELLLSEDRCNA